ncbi:hypothetical protein [Caproiciproducens sp. LBM24188]|nr:hypothetical protein [Oscillospiraceae bacterium]HHV32479.1 hypothetical protein [Clostridiales bacterium]
MNPENRKRIFRIFGAAVAVMTALCSVLSGWVLVKSICYMNRTQKSMKKMEKAADVYLAEHTRKNELP